jgi:hypothetical protein
MPLLMLGLCIFTLDIMILRGTTRHFSNSDTISHCWIATNNRFTSDAIAYASCVDIQLKLGLSKTIA